MQWSLGHGRLHYLSHLSELVAAGGRIAANWPARPELDQPLVTEPTIDMAQGRSVRSAILSPVEMSSAQIQAGANRNPAVTRNTSPAYRA